MFDPDALDRRDPRVIRALLPSFEVFARRYVRLRCDGVEHVPARAGDDVGEVREHVRARMQAALDELAREARG